MTVLCWSSPRSAVAAVFACCAGVVAQDPPAGSGVLDWYVPPAASPMPVAVPMGQSLPYAAMPAYDLPRPITKGPRASIDFAFGIGQAEHETGGAPQLSDETSAGFFRVGFEVIGDSDFGGGVRFETVATDDELFLETSGIAFAADDLELFLHGTGQFGSDAVRVPVRAGLFLRKYGYQDQISASTVDWASIGPRLEVEPDVRLLSEGRFRWSMFGRLGLGAGMALVETDPTTEDYRTTMFAVDLAIGTRLSFQYLQFDIGYLLRGQSFAASDEVDGTFIRAIDTEFSGLTLGLSVRF